MSRLTSTALEYHYGSTRMSGQFVIDDTKTKSGRRPGVLVVHEAFGLGSHAIASAERLAELGYAALAIDLWGERAQITEMPKVTEIIGRLVGDRNLWTGRVEAARQALLAQPKVDGHRLAAIGYCFGGSTVLEYARSGADIRGVVSFHGGLDPVGNDWDAVRTKAKLLLCTGAEDPIIPASSVVTFQDNLRKGGIDWEVNTYGGTKHSFTNPDADKAGMPQVLGYNKQADQRSWASMAGFLAEIFAEG